MIKIEDVEVMGMRKAIKGMRNAMNSWDKRDSVFIDPCCFYDNKSEEFYEYNHIGEKDMELAKRLIKAGSSDRKFMRMIHVQADVTAPLYWWKQADKYCVGVTTNSTSTMHKIADKEFTLDDFSHDNLISDSIDILEDLIVTLNDCRDAYINYDKDINNITKEITSKKHIWWQMIQLLPSSYNQMRTIDLSYENLFNIYHQRKNHKLNEWVTFCEWIETLTYMKEFLNIN